MKNRFLRKVSGCFKDILWRGGDEFIVSFGVNDTKIRGPSEAFYFFCPGRVDNRCQFLF